MVGERAASPQSPLTITRHGGDLLLRAEQVLPLAREVVFSFFADARNLARITPSRLRFEIVTPGTIEMRDGTLIDYRLRVAGVPLRWCTRIVRWRPPREFRDEQLRGPYAEWVHTHRFSELGPAATLMEDMVRFRLPFGTLGRIAEPFVRAQLRQIFGYRRNVIVAWLTEHHPAEIGTCPAG